MSTDTVSPLKRVLVIDDNLVNLKITAALVRRAGFLVDTAETAEAALTQVGSERPDLIVTDLHLNGMDGLDFTRILKQNPEWADIPIVLLTADSSEDVEANAQRSGCACMLAKPVDARLFPGVIAAYLGMPAAIADAPSPGELPIEEVRKQFLADGAAECRNLLSQFASSRQFVPAVDFAAIRKSLHSWAGVGGTVGFPEITRQARIMEALTETSDPNTRADLYEKLLGLLYKFTHAVPVEQPALAPQQQQPQASAATAPVRTKPVVLVADDDATIRAVIRLSVEAAGFECRLAANGALACAIARNDPPDAIVLDLNMPRMDGFQVLYALRSQWSTRRVPVILLSARREESDIVRGAQLGAVEYMTKPFETNDLLTRLSRVIRPREA